jgi:hypothetical protein
MTTGELLYVIGVIAAFTGFGVTLGYFLHVETLRTRGRAVPAAAPAIATAKTA